MTSALLLFLGCGWLLFLATPAPAAPTASESPLSMEDIRVRISFSGSGGAPAYDVLKEGGTLKLTCKVTFLTAEASTKEHNLQWFYIPASDEDSSNVSQVVLVGPEGFVAHGMSAEREFVYEKLSQHQVEMSSIIKPNVTLQDAGLYYCQIFSSGRLVNEHHTLVSVIPKRSSNTLTPQSAQSAQQQGASDSSSTGEDGPVSQRFMVALKGMNVTLECSESDRDAEIIWKKHNDPDFHATGKVTRLIRVDRWDSGNYYCITNTTSLSAYNITLQVKDKSPNIKDSDKVQTVLGEVGRELTLTCQINATPVPRVSWYKRTSPGNAMEVTEATPLVTGAHTVTHSAQGQILSSGEDYNMGITPNGYKDGFMENFLRIKKVSPSDLLPGTEYFCLAENGAGEASKRFVIRKPDPAASKRDRAVTITASSAASSRISASLVSILVYVTTVALLC